MAQEHINTGTPNGNDGDFLRDAFVKVENNTTELYNEVASNASNISTNSSDITSHNDRITENELNIQGLTDAQTGGLKSFKTLALLQAYATPNVNDSYKVTNDPTPANNGFYHWVGGTTYEKDESPYITQTLDPLNTTEAPSNKAVADYTATLRGGEVASGETRDVSGGEIKTAIDLSTVDLINKSISPEENIINIRINGDFAKGVDGYTGVGTITKAIDGANIKTTSSNQRLVYSPLTTYSYNEGDKFLLVYKFSVVNFIDTYAGSVARLGMTDNLNSLIASTVKIAHIPEQVDYEGSEIITVNAGLSGDEFKTQVGTGISGGNEINLKYYMLIPLKGELEGYDATQVEIALNERNKTLDEYFEYGGAALLAINSKSADIATTVVDGAVTMAKMEVDFPDNQFDSLIAEPDLTLGKQNWIETSGGVFTWSGTGVNINQVANGSTQSIRFYRTQPQTLIAGHRYVFFADMDLTGDGTASGGLDNVKFKPFINTSDVTNITIDKFLKVGKDGNTINHKEVFIFDANTTQTTENPYFDVNTYRNINNQNLLTFELNVNIRIFMLIDLGVAGVVDYDERELGNAIYNLGAPYYPIAPAKSKRSFTAFNSTFSDRAKNSDVADLATVSETANKLISPWANKRVLTVGHSLVSQQGWQSILVDKLGMAGYSMYGTAGGTIQPKPLSGTKGMFSRSYVQDVISSSVNIDGITTNGLANVETNCIIIWTGANDNITDNLALENVGFDRIMTIAEQDEFEARNLSSPSTPINTPLTSGLVVTYCTLYLTMLKNIIEGIVDNTTKNIGDRPEYRLFMVREPQAFHSYDGTLHYPKYHFEKNEVHKKVADMMSIPLIDLWNNSGINISTRGMFLSVESEGALMIHLNDKGYRVVADYLEKEMLKYPPLDFTGTIFGTNLGFPTLAADLGPWNPEV